MSANSLPATSVQSAYDALPYESFPFPHLHPARIAATAQLSGYTPPPVQRARVLDIGCGAGGHAIALACYYPEMQIIGVDLAQGQIALGNERIAALGLRNVSLHAGDLGQGLPPSALNAMKAFSPESRFEFDYMLCQGVYYVVPDAVRLAIWQMINAHLAPNGIAHISFNTYPGWKQREVAQDFSQFVARGQELPPSGQETQVRAALAQLAALAPKHTQGLGAGYGLNLQAESEAAQRAIPGLLFHEFISGENRPLYFQDMCDQAQQAGFAYLCEAGLPDAWPGRFGAAMEAMQPWCQGDALRLEQAIDFATARTYRNSLWVKASAKQALPNASAWSAQQLPGLHVAAQLQKVEAIRTETSGTDQQTNAKQWKTESGISFQVSHEHEGLLQALQRGTQSSFWVSASDLLDRFPQSSHVLLECVLRGMLTAMREPPKLPESIGQLSAAFRWLAKDAERSGCRYLPSQLLQPVGLDDNLRQLIAQLQSSADAGLPLQFNEEQSLILRKLGWLS